MYLFFVETKQGVFEWPSGRKYEGEWDNSSMHGKGRLAYEDGNVYIGNFKNDQRSGYGLFVWSDGKRYDGPWQENKQHGIATLELLDGTKVKAEFDKGQKIRYID